jgi:ornithine carbamoyltransferase
MRGKDLLSILDLTSQDILQLLDRAVLLAKGPAPGALAGKTVALLFEKPSLRTRASFHVAVHQLGGYSFHMGPDEVGLGKREPASDVARVLSRYVDCIVARVFHHSTLEELGKSATVPVVNALSDWEHPCQTLADLQTMLQHKGSLRGLKVAYVGDGNNVARSLCLGTASVGAQFVIASPPGYALDQETLEEARRRSSEWGVGVVTLEAPQDAVAGADVVYTDVWTSMGQEAEAKVRRRDFAPYVVDQDLLSRAGEGALLMHPMPAHYGEEVPPGMLLHPQSVAFDQAENRLHAQKAALELIMGRSRR